MKNTIDTNIILGIIFFVGQIVSLKTEYQYAIEQVLE